ITTAKPVKIKQTTSKLFQRNSTSPLKIELSGIGKSETSKAKRVTEEKVKKFNFIEHFTDLFKHISNLVSGEENAVESLETLKEKLQKLNQENRQILASPRSGRSLCPNTEKKNLKKIREKALGTNSEDSIVPSNTNLKA